MDIKNVKIKGPKHFDNSIGEYVAGERLGSTKDYCVQIDINDAGPKQLADASLSNKGVRNGGRGRQPKRVNVVA